MEILNYRDLLKIELADRIAANPSYSLRAMAKKIGISPSMLSALLAGKKKISVERAFEIGKKLKFDKKKNAYFVGLVQLDRAKSPEQKVELLEQLNLQIPQAQTFALHLDHFRMIADWYHLPILEMTQLDHSVLTPSSAATALGISKAEAEAAIDRLLRLDLLEKNRQGQLKKSKSLLRASSDVPNAALRRFHEQMFVKAQQSLHQQSPQEKFVGSETFAFDEKQLKQAEEIFEDCFSRMISLAGSKKSKKQVYHLGIQFFRLTKDIQQ